jgi:hypothetical protein
LARDPWADCAPGAWFRLRTVEPGQETYVDWGLKERGAGYLVVTAHSGIGAKSIGEAQHRYVDLKELTAVARRRLFFGRRTLDLDRMEIPGTTSTARWVFTDGPGAGAVFPSEWAGEPFEGRRLDEQKVTVKGRDFDCLILEGVLGRSGRTARLWISPECPAGPVRAEAPEAVSALVDFGDDWNRRPPFPEPAKVEVAKVEPPPARPLQAEPSKPEPPKPEVSKPAPKPEPPQEDPAEKARKAQAQAATLIREATPLYRGVAETLENPPREAAALQAILKQAEEARRKLTEASTLYAGAKDAAADRAAIDRRIAQIADLVAVLDQAISDIRSRLR